MSVNQRIKDFSKYKNLSIRRFESLCGLSNGYVNNLNYSIGYDKLQKITQTFPDLNPIWLQMGEGEMLKKNEEYEIQDPIPFKLEEPQFEMEAVDRLSKIIEKLLDRNERLCQENERLREELEESKKVSNAQRGSA